MPDSRAHVQSAVFLFLPGIRDVTWDSSNINAQLGETMTMKDCKEINTAELQKQSRQLTSEKMKLYDDYKDGRIDRDSYKQRAG